MPFHDYNALIFEEVELKKRLSKELGI